MAFDGEWAQHLFIWDVSNANQPKQQWQLQIDDRTDASIHNSIHNYNYTYLTDEQQSYGTLQMIITVLQEIQVLVCMVLPDSQHNSINTIPHTFARNHNR